MALSIENEIKKAITNDKKGTIFFPSSFSKFGTATAVRQALKRLECDDFLLRLAHGIYLYPIRHQKFGILYPSLEEIAVAIAKRDKARIIPTGIHALNKLGLSTQVPMNVVYLTDGSARSVKINKGSIKFKKAAPKILSAKSDEIILIIQALKELGQENISLKVKEKIKQILMNVDNDIFIHDIILAPQWINDTIKTLWNNTNGRVV